MDEKVEGRRNRCFKLYKEARINATELLDEARVFLEKGWHARAYFLSYTGIEELAKAIHAADVFTGECKYEDFKKKRNGGRDYHQEKIDKMGWAHQYANSFPYNQIRIGPNEEDFETIIIEKPDWGKRQASLFVDEDGEIEISTPKIKISKEDARGITHYLDTAIEVEWFRTEYEGNQIGTKGLKK